MQHDYSEYSCPELGPCPYCGAVMLVREYTTVWDRGSFSDGVRANIQARCGCGVNLKGFWAEHGGNYLKPEDWMFEGPRNDLKRKWSSRAGLRAFCVDLKEFQKNPEETLKLRVFGNVEIRKKGQPITSKSLMFFEQLVG